jgi:hypothetical protein
MKYTKRQKRVLAKIKRENVSGSMEYQQSIYDNALKLYDLIKDKPVRQLKNILTDFYILIDQPAKLPETKEKINPIAKKMFAIMDTYEYSFHTYDCTGRVELPALIEEMRGLRVTKKKGTLLIEKL